MISSKYRVTKGFKFHAQPQTGAYSCFPGSQLKFPTYQRTPQLCIVGPFELLFKIIKSQPMELEENKTLAVGNVFICATEKSYFQGILNNLHTFVAT